MQKCPHCSAELTTTQTRCPACGLRIGEESVETAVMSADPQADTPTRLETPSKRDNTPTKTTGGSSRFVSRTVLAGRYRVVGLIGKGGLYDNVICTGLMLNTTTDTVDRLIEALDAGLAFCLSGDANNAR